MTAVIKVNRLPSAPYPPTPKYERQTIEVPKDAKVVLVMRQQEVKPPKAITRRGPEKRVLAPEEIERIKALYEAGTWTKLIAKKIGCNQPLVRETVMKLIATGEVRDRRHPQELTEKEAERVLALHRAGISGKRIAKELQCGERLVYEEIAIAKEENRL